MPSNADSRSRMFLVRRIGHEHKRATNVNLNVRLFKTNFNIAETDDISMTFKLNNGENTHMKLFWSFVGSESTLHSCEITGAVEGQWATFAKKASEIGMNGNVALIGLKFENTPANYNVLIGEMSIVPAKTFAPVKPVITTDESNILKKRTYNSLDFKFSWDCESSKNDEDPYIPVYNEDVDTWYFEVYVQAKDEEAVLCGTTSSWAHYVVGAPVSKNQEITDYRIGVCAVAPDGKTKSEITWTGYITIPLTLVDGIQSDKQVIKSGEEFTLSLIDPNQEEPFLWEIIDATAGGDAIASQDEGRSFTTSLSKEGYYDVKVTKGDFTELIYRGFVQISPESTGAIPSITDFTASATELTLSDEGTTEPVTLSFTGKKGEGTVSRGLQVDDPYMFRIPSEFLPMNQNTYTIGLWIKPEKFTFSTFGMGLIEQRNMDIHWPHNNWGSLWVDVWPETYDKFSPSKKILDRNIVSYTMWGGTNHSYGFNYNYNKHEIPNLECCTDGNEFNRESYSLSEGQWTHILISYDGSYQRIYFNGKKVGEKRETKRDYEDLNGYTGLVKKANIYIGGSRVYYAGFTGVIDDVQIWHKALSDSEVEESMKGYYGKEIPSDLKGYWTFENDTYNNDDKTFENLGTRSQRKSIVCRSERCRR